MLPSELLEEDVSVRRNGYQLGLVSRGEGEGEGEWKPGGRQKVSFKAVFLWLC